MDKGIIEFKRTVAICHWHIFRRYIFVISTLFFSFSIISCRTQHATFTNPLLPSGADPWSIYKNGYYYLHTMGDRLVIWKTKSIADLDKAKHKTVFMPPTSTSYSKGLWAPEIHF